MKRNYIYGILASLFVVACSSEGTTVPSTDSEAVPITLAATVEGSATRAGTAGNIDYSVLASTGYGFGVIASQLGWTNQQVTYNGPTPAENPGTVFDYPGSWTYGGDQKYWNKDASGGPVDFYAYAPYVSSGSGLTGITDVSGTSVTYTIATDPDNSVDLLWGVKGTTGLPWTGTTLAQTGGPVLFTFRHALAAIGVEVKSNITDFDDYTLTVDKVELEGSFHKTNTLNLNNSSANTPNWETPSDSESKLTITGAQIAANKLLFVIPNATKQKYTLKLSWKVTKGGDDTSKTSTVNINDLDLLAGTKYHLILNITLMGVTLDVTATDWTGQPVPVDVKIEHGTSASESLAPRKDVR